jgi:hypothetical protein
MNTNDFADAAKLAVAGIITYLPLVLAAILILVGGIFIASLIRRLIVKVLDKLKVDQAMSRSAVGQWLQRYFPNADISKTVGTVTYWFLFLGVVSLAIAALGIRPLTDLIGIIVGYLPNAFAAVLIMVVAAVVASGVSGAIERVGGTTPTARVAKAAAPILILSIATFMALNQLRIAPEIVTITYAALVGSLALGAALAFGLGGRQAAEQLLTSAMQQGNRVAETIKQDVRTAAQNVKKDGAKTAQQPSQIGQRG